MINLRDTYVRVHTREECEKLFEIAKEQGFTWPPDNRPLNILDGQKFPDTISFRADKLATYGHYNTYDVSEIIEENQSEEKEMTAKEFIEGMIKYTNDCDKRESCLECLLYRLLTKNSGRLCSAKNWKGHEEALMGLIKKKLVGMTEEEAAGVLQKYFDSGSCKTTEEQEAIKLAIKKLKGYKVVEEC